MTSDTAHIGEIVVTGVVQKEAWRTRVLPPVELIQGGIWSVPVPFPDNPMRYTLCYVVLGGQGAVVVDPGWQSEDGWQALISGIGVAGLDVRDVVGIVATHVHADHHGLSGRLREASGAWVAMHPAERDSMPARVERAVERRSDTRERIQRLMLSAGAPDTAIQAFLTRFDQSDGPSLDDMVQPDKLIEDGESVPLPGRRLHALWTPGHTPGHLCLVEPDARLLLTGDCVLPRVTPHLSSESGASRSPLRQFVASLAQIEDYDDYEALPAHEYRFRGLAARTRQLREHHSRRCAEIMATVDDIGTPTLWQLAERLTWSRPWPEVDRMQVAALGETLAHVAYLVEEGQLAWLTPAGFDDIGQPGRMRRAG